MTSSTKILLSGVKPTGRPHIGNYFGAMKQFVDLLNSGQYRCYFMVADYHALNTVKNSQEMRQHIVDLALDYLAIGLDPEKAVLFKQSDVSAHTELAWVFDTLVTVPYLQRAHAYKAELDRINALNPKKEALLNKKVGMYEVEINVGTFNYPVLMAADILLYDTDVVPVGQDQKQHIEYARDIAQKFNGTFGELFKLPKALILEDVATVPGTDGRKMSKSYNNTIPLFADDETIKKAVMSMVTDSKGADEPKDPEHDTIFAIHKLFTSPAELAKLADQYKQGTISYKESKELLIQKISMFIAPLRERRAELQKDVAAVQKILERGAEQACAVANAKMKEVRKMIGVDSQ